MRKLSIVLSTLSVSFASPNLMALTSGTLVATVVNGAALNMISEVPDYASVAPELLLQNVIKNPDGSMTIKAGQQSAQANAMNRSYCHIVGDTDITNESDRKIDGGTLYPVVCKSPAGHYPPAIATAVFRLEGTQQTVDPTAGAPKTVPKDERGMYLNPFGKK